MLKLIYQIFFALLVVLTCNVKSAESQRKIMFVRGEYNWPPLAPYYFSIDGNLSDTKILSGESALLNICVAYSSIDIIQMVDERILKNGSYVFKKKILRYIEFSELIDDNGIYYYRIDNDGESRLKYKRIGERVFKNIRDNEQPIKILGIGCVE